MAGMACHNCSVKRLPRWIRTRLPRDRAKRTLILAIVTSALFHLLFFLPFMTIPGFLQSPTYVKRGEPLLVDIAPERPDEKAPRGNPSQPVAPPESREQPSPPAANAPAPSQSPQVAVARPPTSIWRQPGGGGGVQGGGRGGVEGQPIPLDTPEPKFQDYFNKVRERIKANWVYPRQAGERNIEGELVIEFHIAKDGRLEYIELRDSSGTRILDDAALTAVKLAQPFPPVPDDIAKHTLAINGQFRYQIVSGLVNQFLR